MAGKALIFSYAAADGINEMIMKVIDDAGDKYAEYALWTPADEAYEGARSLELEITGRYDKPVSLKPVKEAAYYDFDESYKVAIAWFRDEWLKRYGRQEIVINYTRGHRDGAYGLISAALALGINSFVRTIGQGSEVKKPEVKTGIDRIANDQNFLLARRLFATGNNEAAAGLLDGVDMDRLVVVSPGFGRLFRLLNRFYQKWDLFDHRGAKAAMDEIGKGGGLGGMAAGCVTRYPEHCRVVGLLSGHADSGERATGRKGVPREILADLLNNAERRFEAGRYDDAVARLYRACEALGDIVFSECGVDRSNVDPGKIPDGPAREYCNKLEPSRGKRQLGLQRTFELMALWPDGKIRDIGAKFIDNKGLRQKLEARNSSILAHGFAAVDPLIYKGIREEIIELISAYYPKLRDEMERLRFPELIEEPAASEPAP